MATDISKRIFQPIDNYIYLYHTNTLIILPGYPQTLSDNTSIRFNSSTSLGRSAPIYSYQNSGPRSISVTLSIHREALNLMNYTNSNSDLKAFFNPEDDYTDVIIRQLQAAALPVYAGSEKMVDPPMVACRFGNDIYIKGVLVNSVGVSYGLPVLRNNKLAKIDISFTVEEVDAYDAMMISQIGSYRDPGDINLNTNLDREVYYSGAGQALRSMGGGNRATRISMVK